jgi:hypothetical protein
MKRVAVLVLALAFSSTASADIQSVMGGKKLTQDTVHNTGVGWPGIFYEWWNNGSKMDWALGTGLVYGEWEGGNNDGRGDFIEVGGEFYAPLRWHLKTGNRPKTTIDTSLRFTPGILLAGATYDRFTFGIRGEIAVPISIRLHERVNLVTGATIPISIFIVEDTSDGVAIPIYARLGVEIDAAKKASPWFMFELGPNIQVFGGDSETDFGFRVWVGTSFWSILK